MDWLLNQVLYHYFFLCEEDAIENLNLKSHNKSNKDIAIDSFFKD